VLDEVSVSPASGTVRTLAEATLAVVLFADASRIKLRVLRQEYAVPLRLLGIGLPSIERIDWGWKCARFWRIRGTGQASARHLHPCQRGPCT
jgi:hypothetical protein